MLAGSQAFPGCKNWGAWSNDYTRLGRTRCLTDGLLSRILRSSSTYIVYPRMHGSVHRRTDITYLLTFTGAAQVGRLDHFANKNFLVCLGTMLKKKKKKRCGWATDAEMRVRTVRTVRVSPAFPSCVPLLCSPRGLGQGTMDYDTCLLAPSRSCCCCFCCCCAPCMLATPRRRLHEGISSTNRTNSITHIYASPHQEEMVPSILTSVSTIKAVPASASAGIGAADQGYNLMDRGSGESRAISKD